MKFKTIIPILAILLAIGLIVLVKAQVTSTISPRCNANGIINVDFAYKIYLNEGHTNYIAMLEAGRCKRDFRGTVNRVADVETAIRLDIANEMLVRSLSFYPDPFGDLDVDGRGSFTIP